MPHIVELMGQGREIGHVDTLVGDGPLPIARVEPDVGAATEQTPHERQEVDTEHTGTPFGLVCVCVCVCP